MASEASIAFGNFLFKNSFPLYKIMYQFFKERQDAFEIDLIKKVVKPNATVIDIGANIGFYSEILSKIVGANGSVHCFEPDITNFNYLQKRCASLANVTMNKKAIADTSQNIKIYTSKKLNVDHRTYKPDEFDTEIDIEAISLDEYLSGKSVDFIKMDIQGFEMAAVKGMLNTLRNNNLKMLSEFWPYGMKKAGSSVMEYFTLLKQLQFTIYLIKDKTLIELTVDDVNTFSDLPEHIYMNIFVSKEKL